MIGVASDPEPNDAVGGGGSHSAMRNTYAHRIQSADPLEVQRGMLWILLQKGKILVRENANCRRQIAIVLPKLRRGVVFQSSVVCLLR